MDEAAEHLQTLELAPGATWEQVRRSYRDLAQVWHPDRFGANERLRQRAQDRLASINHAYGCLSRIHAAGNWDSWEDKTPQTSNLKTDEPFSDAGASSPAAVQLPFWGLPALWRIVYWVRSEWLVVLFGLLVLSLVFQADALWGLVMMAVSAVFLIGAKERKRWEPWVAGGFGAVGLFLLVMGLVPKTANGILTTATGSPLHFRRLVIGSGQVCGTTPAGVYCWGIGETLPVRVPLTVRYRVATRARFGLPFAWPGRSMTWRSV